MKFKNYKAAGEKYSMGGDWMNLEEGENKVRIVSQFEDYGSHFDSKTKKSSICLGKENCPLCQAGNKPRVQFLGWVIDRKDSEEKEETQVKLLRIGYKIFQQIGDFASNKEYAFEEIPDYDITIKKTGQGLDTDYSVLPARKNTALTAEEKKIVKETVKPPQEIIEKMKAKQAVKTGAVPYDQIPVVEENEVAEEEGAGDVDVADIPF